MKIPSARALATSPVATAPVPVKAEKPKTEDPRSSRVKKLASDLKSMKAELAAILAVLTPEQRSYLLAPKFEDALVPVTTEHKPHEWYTGGDAGKNRDYFSFIDGTVKEDRREAVSWKNYGTAEDMERWAKSHALVDYVIGTVNPETGAIVPANKIDMKNELCTLFLKRKRMVLAIDPQATVTYTLKNEQVTMKTTDAMMFAYALGHRIDIESQRVSDIAKFWPTYPEGEPKLRDEDGNPLPTWMLDERDAARGRAEDKEAADAAKARKEAFGEAPQVHMLADAVRDAVYEAMRNIAPPRREENESDQDYNTRKNQWAKETAEKMAWPATHDDSGKVLPGTFAEHRLSGDEYRARKRPVMWDPKPTDKPNRIKVGKPKGVAFEPDVRLRGAGISDAIIARRSKGSP